MWAKIAAAIVGLLALIYVYAVTVHRDGSPDRDVPGKTTDKGRSSLYDPG
jgi:hypothetical protein